jgi:hypothetical protein
MTKMSVEIGLTLSLKNRIKGASDYEFIRPRISIDDIEVDGDLSVKEQLSLARKAIRPTWDLVDLALEKLIEEQFAEGK